MSFFTGHTRTAAARSSTFTDLFYIKREIFLSLLEEYPNDKVIFIRKSLERIFIIGNVPLYQR